VLPIKDNVPTHRFPYVTIALIVANFAIWVFYELPNMNHAVDQLAFHPCEVEHTCRAIGQGWIITALTSMFMHGGWLHILGNMLFLWIFGNNVEDAMGHVKFLIFYVLAGLAALFLQSVITITTESSVQATVPFLGASGAISGVLGAYFVLLPRASVLTLVFFFLPIMIPAWVFLVLWFGFQLIASSASLQHPEAGGGVAFFAHIGGFVFGLLTVRFFKTRDWAAPAYR
jgi:membrane associated rhomboid family serine protease